MFERLSDDHLIDVMGEVTRDESAAIAHRLAAVAELYVRRAKDGEERDWWVVDNCAAVAAEIAAVQNISQDRAVAQVQCACNLAQRLPALARVFATGVIDYRVVAAIINRTDNVQAELMPALDEAIARHAQKWMKLSKTKLRDRIDMWVAKFDPAAVRVPPSVEDNRYFDINPHPSAPGMALISASLGAADGAAIDARLEAIAATVCDKDPRTKSQRRTDAAGVMGRGEATLACQCGTADCPAQAERDTTTAVVIHVLAEQATLEGTSNTPGYLEGFGILPAQSVRDLAATAKFTPVKMPCTTPEPGYRPTARLADFLRWRDLTCCFPGCDRPVARCDVDHTVPWPAGPTHPGNNKHYCRIHHLVKTFYCGPGGWAEAQRPDGTIVFTAPTGHLYTTRPHGAVLFPTLGAPTGALILPTDLPPPDPARSAMMPRRKRTRAQNHQDRINAERRIRAALNAAQQLSTNPENPHENPYFPTHPPHIDPDDPPPF